MKESTIVSLRDISVDFDGDPILVGLDLDIRDKEFVTLLGPSGCGKTTTLRTIGGFVTPKSGDVFFDGVRINDLPPYKRQVNTVFQRYALFPHLNVFENVEFGLKLKKLPENERKTRVWEMLDLVNLTGYDRRNIDQLSGGQQQRVAIARALVNHPRVLLLDEPLGALDLKLRKEMQVELKRMQQRLGITFIYVTHDQEEALTMSDTIVVLKDGVIQQIGTPADIYNEPKNPFVADFIGESNIVPGIMLQDYRVQIRGAAYECVDAGFGRNVEVDVVVRPEGIDIVPPDQARLRGVVQSVVFMGVHYEVDVDCGGYEWVVHTTDYVAVGDEVGLSLPPDAFHVMKKTRSMNIFDAVAYPEDGFVTFGGHDFPCALGEGFASREPVLVQIQPADVELIAPQDAELTGFVKACMFLGTHYEVTVTCGEEDWIARADDIMETGEETGVRVRPGAIAVSHGA